MRSRRLANAALAVCFASGALAQSVSDPGLEVETVASGLGFAITMEFVGDNDILVLSKFDGKVLRVIDGVLQPGAVLDVAVNASSERGLLGIARDPGFPHNRYIYLYYTESSTGADGGAPSGNRIYRYTWTGSTLVDPRLILDLPADPGPNHDGGIIAFGGDDRLYAVIGDLNRNGKLENFPDGLAPDDTAVILRVDVHGNGVHDNPFYDETRPGSELNRYFAYGVRNSFGMAFDPLTGDLWNTENGPSLYDEVNRFDAGANSGWERIMGPDARDSNDVSDLWSAPGSFYVDPQFSWLRTVAPTAVAFAESPVVGCANAYAMFVGDSNCGQIYRFDLDEDRKSLVFSDTDLADRVADNSALRCEQELGSLIFGTGFGILTDIKPGPDGRLYVVSASPGAIYRIGPKRAAIVDMDQDGVEDTCDCDSGDPSSFAIPPTVPRLRMYDSSETTLVWDSQLASGGTGTAHSVISGDLSSLWNDRDFSGACTLIDAVGGAIAVDARPDPTPGAGVYYLVRAGNGCGAGTFGDSGELPDPRDLLDASTPPACGDSAGPPVVP